MVYQGDASYTGGRQVQGGGTAKAACAQHQGMALQQTVLPGIAQFVKKYVARVPQQLGVIHPLLFLFFHWPLGQCFADLHRLAFQVVERLLQLEVFGAAELGGFAISHRFSGFVFQTL
jgi:hypothetical protein